MTEQPTPDHQVNGHDAEPAAGMPRWVPVLIGLVLAGIAALAVYTGLRYRETDTLTEHVAPRRDRTNVAAPPGEPGAGASLVMHGDEGETTPAAGAPVVGESRTVISGGRGGVTSTVRLWARRGMIVDVQPPDATVHVNGVLIGPARQFDTMDEVYDFAAPGSYNIRIVAPSGAEKTFVVTAADEAKDDVATIAAKLQ